MKRHEAEVAETLQYMVSPQGRNTWTIDDLVPYVEKITILSEEQERITDVVAHAQEFHILQSSVETRGLTNEGRLLKRKNFPNKWRSVAMECITRHQHFLSILHRYQYPFEGHHTDMSASEHSLGGVAKTHPHFSWPTMTPSQQHDAPIATPNAPLAPQ
ncbi:hypothetical protein GmHk_16G046817 [Glycine max]|nr:hypothetical protein GmHk_16G046817 [Glycine max]